MDESINQLQETLLQMLADFDEVCRKYDIKYTLFAGTALGAVRHQGFIPWDDDLDIIMLRSEYERFFELAAKDFSKNKYYVQKEYSPHWPMFFSKLRLNNTAAIEKYHPKDALMHQGVYIDIFPCDNLYHNRLAAQLQFAASKVIIAKSLDKRGYETNSKIKKLFMAFCRFMPQKPLHRFCVNRKADHTQTVHSFFGCSSKYEKSIYPKKWFTEITYMQFGNGEYPVSAHYDELLTKLYDDYMVLPPAEARKCKQHIAILDLNKNYTAYLDMQKNMKIDTFTRCIR